MMDATTVSDVGIVTGVVKFVLMDPPGANVCDDESVLVMEIVAVSPLFMLLTVRVDISAFIS